MKKTFALGAGASKRLEVSWGAGYRAARVSLDGAPLAGFATREEFEQGTTVALPDKSSLQIRLGPVAGAPMLKGVHLVHQGRPVPGSAADPVPPWVWPFALACAAIPVVTLGGAVPVALGLAGASGTFAAARARSLTAPIRVVVCALLVVAAWGGLAALGLALNHPGTVRFFMSSTPHKLLKEIEAGWVKQGWDRKVIDDSIYGLQVSCDKLGRKACVEHLQATLLQIRQSGFTVPTAPVGAR